MASNIVKHGVFGITPYEFSSSTSSPLWTLLLALLYFAFGASESLPLLLNYLCGAAAILVIWRFGRDAGVKGLRLGIMLGAIVLLHPMMPLAFTGMEHLLHLVAVLLMLYALWRLLCHSGPVRIHALLPLGVFTAVAVAVRYESLFLAAAACPALAVKRRWAAIAVCATGALIPVCVFGIFLVTHGQHFLPNSLLLKGNFPQWNSAVGIAKALGADGLRALVRNPHLYVLVTCLVLLFWRDRAIGRGTDGRSLLVAVVLGATVLHLQFAATGWFYRYEAYLVGIGLMVSSMCLDIASTSRALTDFRQGSWAARASLVVLICLLLFPLAERAAAAHWRTIRATRNIYQQQYQMGQFLHRFYDGECVAANDMGAINYVARLECLDLWGLGSREVAYHKRRGTYSTATIRALAAARGVRVAVLYPSWFRGKKALPEEWTIVGTWTIRDNVVCGNETVAFVALSPSEVGGLLANLRSFAGELPPGVVWQELVAGEVMQQTDAFDETQRTPRALSRK